MTLPNADIVLHAPWELEPGQQIQGHRTTIRACDCHEWNGEPLIIGHPEGGHISDLDLQAKKEWRI